jgi:hypothetical protein
MSTRWSIESGVRMIGSNPDDAAERSALLLGPVNPWAGSSAGSANSTPVLTANLRWLAGIDLVLAVRDDAAPLATSTEPSTGSSKSCSRSRAGRRAAGEPAGDGLL